jgi:hypothetical protein
MTNQLTKTLFLEIGRKRVQVASFEEASRMFCAVRNRAGTGASRTPPAKIVDEAGKRIGYVAYNGRVFEGTPQAWTSSTRLLYDNCVVG